MCHVVLEGVKKNLISLHDPKITSLLEIAFKKPHHGVKRKGLPNAVKLAEENSTDCRGVMRTFTLPNYIISS